MNSYNWITNIWDGGISMDTKNGFPAARFIKGFDVLQDKNLLQLSPTMAKHNGATDLDDSFVKWIIPATNNKSYLYALNEIYEEDGGTYSNVHTPTGTGWNGQGMAIFDGDLYYRGTSAIGQFDLSSTWDDTWKQSGDGVESVVANAPMLPFKNLLLIANGRYLATIDDVAATWTAQRLSFPSVYSVETMCQHNRYACIGVNLTLSGNSQGTGGDGIVFFWDGVSETYEDYAYVGDRIHALKSVNGVLYAFIGDPVKIAVYTGSGFKTLFETKLAYVFPGAVVAYANRLLFGGYGYTSNNEYPVSVVYEWGEKKDSRELVLNPKYETPGTAGISALALVSRAVSLSTTHYLRAAYGTDVASLTLATNSGSLGTIAKPSWTYTKPGVFRSLNFDNNNSFLKTPQQVIIELDGNLATDEEITFKLTGNPYGDPTFASAPISKTFDDTYTPIESGKLVYKFGDAASLIKSRDLSYELQVTGTSSGAPKIKRVIIALDEHPDQL